MDRVNVSVNLGNDSGGGMFGSNRFLSSKKRDMNFLRPKGNPSKELITNPSLPTMMVTM